MTNISTHDKTTRADRRILALGPHYADYTAQLCIALAEHGRVRLELASHAAEAELTGYWSRTLRSRCEVVEYNTRNKLLSLLNTVAIVLRALKFKPDAIIAPEIGSFYYTLAIFVLKFFFPIYLIVHDPKPHSGADAVYAKKIRARLETERKSATAFIVHGAFCEKLLTEHHQVGLRPILSIPHGPILSEPSSGAPQKHSSGALMFGRMQAYKGLGVFLEALKRAGPKAAAFDVLLAGKGPELTRLEQEFKAIPGLQIIEGFISQERVIELLQAAKIVVLPYLDATQSGVVAAAFANACPVIATTVGSIPEVVKNSENGLLIPPADPDALLGALEKFFGDEELQQRLNQGAAATSKATAWDGIAAKIVQFIR